MLAICPCGRCRVRCALPTGSLEGGRGFRRLPFECGAGGGVFRQRGVVSRLKFRELRRGAGQLRSVPPLCLLPRSVGGGQLPFKAHASVRFLSEPIFERRLTRRGRGQILCCLLLRRLRFGQRAFERGPRGSRVRQSSAQLRFHAGDLPGGRCRFRYALPTGSLEGGRGFRRLPFECGAGGGASRPARRRIALEVPRAPRLCSPVLAS